MIGISILSVEKEPVYKLPENWTNLKICVHMTGGVGDAVVACGGTALALKKKQCEVTVAVMEHQTELLSNFVGVDDAIPSTKLNQPLIRNSFDVILTMGGVFNVGKHLRDKCYYQLVSEKVGIEVGPGKLNLDRWDLHPKYFETTCFIHPGSSNPNRRWSNENWSKLSDSLIHEVDCSHNVIWLGTKDEYGKVGPHSCKMSDKTENLWNQVLFMAGYRNESIFVGNDSGFCHIAGVLGIPGRVLFGASDPKHVIGRYPSLKPVDCFEELGRGPTRSLNPNDELSLSAMKAITVKKVLDSFDLHAIDCTPKEKEQKSGAAMEYTSGLKHKIAVVGKVIAADNLASFLMNSYDVELLESRPKNGLEFAALITFSDKWTIETRDKRKVSVCIDEFENVQRALREVLAR